MLNNYTKVSNRSFTLPHLGKAAWLSSLVLAMLLISSIASAADYYSRNSGTWSGNNRWSTVSCGGASAGGAEPVAGDSATICNGHTITLDISIGGAGLTALTVDAGGALELSNGNTNRTLTVAGDVSNAGTLSLPTNRNATITLNIGGNITNTGTFDFRTDADSLVNTTFTGGGTHTIDGNGAMRFNNVTVNNNLIINKAAGAITQTGTLSVTGNLVITAGTLSLGNTTTVSGDTSITGTLDHANTNGTRTFTGAVTINNGGNWNNPVNQPITMGNSLTNNGIFTSGTGLYTFQTTANAVWAGTAGLTFGGAVNVNASRINNTTMTVAGALTIAAAVTVTNNSTVTVSGSIVGSNATTSIWNNTANSILNAADAVLAVGVLDASASGNTVNYNGTVAQTIKSTNYHHLTVNKSANTATTTTNNLNVAGDLTVSNGTLNLANTTVVVTGTTNVSGTLGITNTIGTKTFNGNVIINNGASWNHTVNSPITLNGNLTNNGTFTADTGAAAIYTFAGGSAQSITGTAGTTTIPRLTLNNTNGLSLTGTHDLTVSTLLTLTNGRIRTNANILFVSYTAGSGAIAGASATDFVVGNLRKAYTASATQTRLFEVGTETGGVRYAPVSVTLVVPGGGGGNFTVSSTAGDHPDIATSTLDPAQSINRFWTLTNNSVNFSTNANTSIAFTYVNPDDYDGGADFNDFYVGRYNAPDWVEIEPSARTATTTTISGTVITTAVVSGIYQIAERLTTPPPPAAAYRMDEFFWDGTAGEVVDSGSGGFHGTAAGLSATLPTTANINPAIPADPGTCRYGVFDRSNKDYIALPGSFPNLAATGSAGFTITAWINTTNNLLPGQRIFIDDQGNASPGGWGFSVGETAAFGAGGVRFYYRQPAVFLLDTAPIPSNQWLFTALSVRLAPGANASSAVIYVYNTSGTLVTSQSNNFTWTAGSDAGPSSIGGETNAAGENTNAFGFSGNIDEVRVYSSGLSNAQILTIMNDTRTCPTEVATATVSVPATGGEAISADTTGAAYTALTDIVISESDTGGMQVGTYTLTAPAGFEFDTTTNSVSIAIGTVSGTGTNINLGGGAGVTVTITPAASVITFNVTGLSGGARLNNLTFTGIGVRPVDGCSLVVADDIIFATTTSTTITSDVAGTLTMIAGNATSMYTILPGQSPYDDSSCGSVSGMPDNQVAGNAFNLTRLVVTDQFGNIQQAYTGVQTISYSGPGIANGTPPVYTNSVSFTNGQSTTTLNTILYRAETTTITATDGVLTGIASSPFNVVGGTATLMHVVLPGQAFVSGDGAIDTPTDQVLNVPFLLTALVASDAYYNLATFSGSHAITYTLSPPAGGSTFTTPVSFTAGVSTTTLTSTITIAGNYTLSASGGGLTAVTSTAFNVRGSFICTGWDFHKVITIDHTRVGSGGVTDFPVLISITDTDLRDKALANGNDILFTDTTSTIKLAHEIERWDNTTGELIAWVKVPSVSSAVDTEIILYYGNPFAAPQQAPAQVWDANYRMVQHLNESGGVGTTLVDSTVNTNNGSVLGTGGNHPTFVSGGKIDGSRNHPGVTSTPDPVLEFAHTASLAITGSITGEAWAYIESGQPTPDHNPVFWKGTQIGWGANYQFRIAVGPTGVMTWGVTCGATEGYFEAGTPVLNQWAHYALTWDGTTARAYINGVLQTMTGNPAGATACASQSLNATTAPVRSGFTPGRSTPTEKSFLRGQTDELRISATARSVAWLVTQYNNQNSPSTFYSIGSEQAQTCIFLDHIRIEHDGLALSCAPETVTVRACADAACSSEYTDGEVITTLTPSGWVGGNTINFTGSTTASLRQNIPGIVALGSGSTTPAPANTTRCFIGLSETCSIDFKDSGFIFDIPTLTSHKTSSPVTITAVRTDETTQTCAPAFTGARSVNFWSTYSSPATGSQQVQVNSTDVATSGPGGTPVSLNFDVNAQVNITVRYPDAGQMQLNARYTGSGDEAGLIMDGNDQFVSVPAGLCVETDSVCPTADIACDIFAAAGSPFELRVKAVGWESDGETDEQFCSGNAVTQNFRLDNIALVANLVAPVAGVDGTLGITSIDIEAADNGLRTETTQTISEVGVFAVTATPPAYFGETIAASTSDNIGRFIPYDFEVALTAPPVFSTACNVFTYIGQPFGFITDPVMTVTARAEGGSTTENYTATFNRITTGSLSFPGGTNQGFREGSPATLGLDTGLLSGWGPDISDLGGGLTTLTFSFNANERISFNRLAPVEPFAAEISLEIDVVDVDGVVYGDGSGNEVNPARFGNTGAGQGISFDIDKEQRWGRLNVGNPFGSELLPLTIPLQAEYYLDDDSGFVPNLADMCTTYQAADITVVDASPLDNLDAATLAVLVPAGPTILVDGRYDPMNPLILSSSGDVSLGPGDGNTGAVEFSVDLSTVTGSQQYWLQFDWDNLDQLNDGPYDGNPSGRATFGIYRGAKDFIYIREPW